jgi:multidrug efflux pump
MVSSSRWSPSISELGNSDGFTFRLQDRGSKGHAALLAARNQLVAKANQSPVLTGVRFDGVDDAPNGRWTSTAMRSMPSA